VEVPAPAAARAVVGDPLPQPVPLHRADRGFGVKDQAGDLLAAPLVLGGLVPGQPGTARDVAVLDMNRPAIRGPIGDQRPTPRADPGQRRSAPLPAGNLLNDVLGGREQQFGAGVAADPVEHAGQVLIGMDAARRSDPGPPAAGRPGRRRSAGPTPDPAPWISCGNKPKAWLAARPQQGSLGRAARSEHPSTDRCSARYRRRRRPRRLRNTHPPRST
jgi:hypothetical protein